jgi:hypothetical protein
MWAPIPYEYNDTLLQIPLAETQSRQPSIALLEDARGEIGILTIILRQESVRRLRRIILLSRERIGWIYKRIVQTVGVLAALVVRLILRHALVRLIQRRPLLCWYPLLLRRHLLLYILRRELLRWNRPGLSLIDHLPLLRIGRTADDTQKGK